MSADDPMQLFHQLIAVLEKQSPQLGRAKTVIRSLADAVLEADNEDLANAILNAGNDLNKNNVPATLVVLNDMKFEIEDALNRLRSPPTAPPAISMSVRSGIAISMQSTAPTPAPPSTPATPTPRPAFTPDPSATFPFERPQPVTKALPSAVPTQPPTVIRPAEKMAEKTPKTQGSVAFVPARTPFVLLGGTSIIMIVVSTMLIGVSVLLIAFGVYWIHNSGHTTETVVVEPVREPMVHEPVTEPVVVPIVDTTDSGDTNAVDYMPDTPEVVESITDNVEESVVDKTTDLHVMEVRVLSGPDKGKTLRLTPITP